MLFRNIFKSSERVRPLLIVLSLLTVTSCGLPSYPALNAPVPPATLPTESSYEFSFSVPAGNRSSVFQGFEIYYKLYSDIDVYDDHLVDSDTQKIVDFLTLTQLGFHRLLLSGSSTIDDPKPLIPSANDPTLAPLVIDFSPLFNSSEGASKYPSIASGDTTFSLARNAARLNAPIQRKGFSPDQFSRTNDTDIPPTFNPDQTATSGSRLFIALFVLAYGVDIDANEFNIYSEPTFIGYIALPTAG